MRPTLEIIQDWKTLTQRAAELGLSIGQLRYRMKHGLIECDRVIERRGQTLYLWKK